MGGKLKIQELAKQTGLSISSVSRVLAGKPTGERIKQIVLECARQQGVLQDISKGRLLFDNIMLFAPPRAFDVRTDVFYYRSIQGIRRAIAEHPIRLSCCGIEETHSDARLFLQKITGPRVDAIIIIGIDDPAIFELAADRGKPCVIINSRDASMRLDCVLPNNRLIGQSAASYLINHGHRNILNLMCLRRHTLEDRLTGVRAAFATYNIRFDPKQHLIVTNGFGSEESRQAIYTHFKSLPLAKYPTAILSVSDFMAVGASQALEQLGLRVPDDVSIISTDGTNLAELHDDFLTAFYCPRDELGEEAIRLLQQRSLRPDAPTCNLELNGRLIVRNSVKRIGSHKQKTTTTGRYAIY